MNTGPDRQLNGSRVLVAEDDAILAFDMMNFLRQAGAEAVGPASTLKRALRLAETEPLTCGILDVNLRDETVFPAAEVLRARGISIVFCTGYGDMAGLKREWPGAQILTKPAPSRLLLQTVSAACCSRGQHADCPAS